jgi:hypothetical protein
MALYTLTYRLGAAWLEWADICGVSLGVVNACHGLTMKTP